MNDRFCRNVLAFVASEVFFLDARISHFLGCAEETKKIGDVCMQAIPTVTNTALSSQSCARLRVGRP